ncbi:arabinan endo-1,5-alpha-L-arabinosidase [Gracilibacillus ureilyticus]|uniref:Endo-alpha-(1->5)-L-arabinanase n=1 Tax=Gracilibacillus ureilyticus TaxID=531814 RepID=A0A1H9VK34_9BACI|nr:arabinan endo-1,5-alpha-L-arabinosidase [Gracilibacillus ureilyticus]SES22136.1 arabinan endo-1,5-alpha-L-arabinosidase [Gracilibacillus ureilyticus]
MKKTGAIIAVLFSVALLVCTIVFYEPIANITGGTRETVTETKLEMTGDIGGFDVEKGDDPTHDPSIFKADDTYYVVSTGIARNEENPGGIFIRKSEGALEGPWESIGELPVAEWTKEYNVHHLWAPHVAENDGTYYLYYSASMFGTNYSAIGVASTSTPEDTNSWEDHGPIIQTTMRDSFNAIDPMAIEDDGKWWLLYGSHFGGIVLKELVDMTETTGEEYVLASRQATTEHNAIEGPTIFKKDDYYYLLTSWDKCCSGVDSTYKVAVGRSESIIGPYVDSNGVALLDGGGDVILEAEDNQIGPGGQDVIEEDGNYYMVYHYYDGDANGTIRMQIRRMNWEVGWPSFK